MNFKEAVETGFKKYADFSGRAARSEYWFWALFVVIVNILASIIDSVVFGAAGIVGVIVTLGLFIPGIAVTARRLHDIGKSGWWQLLAITIIGLIPLLIWYCTKGPATDNAFGPDPLAGKTA